MYGPVHETFVIETDIEVGPAEVFAAYADVHVRVGVGRARERCDRLRQGGFHGRKR
jgi:hypothetical protein